MVFISNPPERDSMIYNHRDQLMLSDQALENEGNRLAAVLQHRLDNRLPWTPELRATREELRAITKEQRAREYAREARPEGWDF